MTIPKCTHEGCIYGASGRDGLCFTHRFFRKSPRWADFKIAAGVEKGSSPGEIADALRCPVAHVHKRLRALRRTGQIKDWLDVFDRW